eukprot:3356723-Pyramimonas_sp.AAC.1
MRVSRDAADTLECEKELAGDGARRKSERPTPPPGPSAVQVFTTIHILAYCGCGCLKCCSSAARATRAALIDRPCFEPSDIDGSLFGLPIGVQLHTAGGLVHSSHRMRVHKRGCSRGVVACLGTPPVSV